MATPLPLLPRGVLFKGAFITPNNGSYDIAFVSFDFVGEWKSRIDVAKSLGFNCVQFICDVAAPTAITLAVYLARLKQILDYCASLGMFVLPIGSCYIGNYTVSVATATAVLVSTAQLCAKYPNVVGFACTDESVQTASFAHATDSVNEYIAVKAAAPSNFPITCSSFYVQGSNAEWVDGQGYSTACDFLLWNLNPGTPTGSVWDTMRSTCPNHEHFFNTGYGQSDGAFTTNFAAQNIIGTNNVRGNTIFSQEDFSGGSGYGLYSGINTGARSTRVTAATTAFGSNPIKPQKPLPGNHRFNQIRQWG